MPPITHIRQPRRKGKDEAIESNELVVKDQIRHPMQGWTIDITCCQLRGHDTYASVTECEEVKELAESLYWIMFAVFSQHGFITDIAPSHSQLESRMCILNQEQMIIM